MQRFNLDKPVVGKSCRQSWHVDRALPRLGLLGQGLYRIGFNKNMGNGLRPVSRAEPISKFEITSC